MAAFLPPPPPNYAVVITEDHGGYVNEYEAAVAQYNREGRRVEIRGACNSACTLALAVHNVCVGKDAVVRWHQAYEEKGHKLRSDVTQKMVAPLPARLRQYIDGKIQISYTPETTLYYSHLIALGIQDCDAPSYNSSTVQAKVNYENVPSFPTTSTTYNEQPVTLSPQEQKEVDWAKYWEWAADTSKAQFGKLNMKKYQHKNGVSSINIYYWDKNGMYVTAAQYSKNDIAFERKVCRGNLNISDEMICTDWMTDKKTVFEYNDFTDSYQQARD